MMKWHFAGKPPHPFLLADKAVDWRPWVHDLVQIMALVGMDLMLLSCAQSNWEMTMYWLRIILGFIFFFGFVNFLYSVTSKNSPYYTPSKDSLPASSQYQDVAKSLPHITIVLLTQMILMKFYLNEMSRFVPFTMDAYKFWLCAIPIQVIA